MTSLRQRLLHIFGVTIVLLLSNYCLYSLNLSVQQSPQLNSVFLYYIPISMLLQSLIVTFCSSFESFQKRHRTIDSLSIILIEGSIIFILLCTPPHQVRFLTGITVACSVLIRSTGVIAALTDRQKPGLNQSILVGLVTVSLLLPLSGWRMVSRPMNGDEPFYLLLTYSILHDHDINLENNYTNRDSLKFLDRELKPQQFDDYVNGSLISRHPPLMAMFLLPGFLVAGKTGAALTMILLAGILAAATMKLLLELKLPPDISFAATIFMILSAPVQFYSMSVFSELPAAITSVIAVCYGIRIAERKRFSWIVLCLITILALGLKIRFAALCVPPLVLGVLFRAENRRNTVRYLLGLTAILAGIGIVNTAIYGSPLVRYSLHDLTGLTGVRLFRGLIGLLWDPQYGVFPLNPLLLLCLPGITLWIRKEPMHRSLIWISSIVPYYLLIAGFAEMTGGICPRGRFLVAWLPLLTPTLVLAIDWLRKRQNHFIYILFAVFSITLNMVLISKPDWQIVQPGQTDFIPAIISQSINSDGLQILPSFDRVTDSLFRQGWSLVALMLALMLLPLMLKGKPVRQGLKRTSVIILITAILICAGCSLARKLQTEWMEVEDPSFAQSGNATTFWEENRSWEYLIKTDSPYRMGVRLGSGAHLERNWPFLGSKNASAAHFGIEVIARGSLPDKQIPSMNVYAGEDKIATIRLRSTRMESYICPWPYGDMAIAPTFSISSNVSSDSNSYVDIDRLRLIPWSGQWPIRAGRHNKVLPVDFGFLKISDVQLETTTIEQGNSQKISFKYQMDDSDVDTGLLLIAETRTSLQPLVFEKTVEEKSISFDLQVPDEVGTGVFQILIYARKKTQSKSFIEPDGLNCYRVGHRAWLGSIHVTPSPTEISEHWINVVNDNQDSPVVLLPESIHLGRNTEVSIPIKQDGQFKRFFIVSHLSSVFEEIPFESMIGVITLKTSTETKTYDVIIGQQTAESKYEFSGKELKLSHPRPDVFHRESKQLEWPLLLEGIEYDSLVYKADFPVLTIEEPIELRVRMLDYPGTWNIYAIGFELTE